MVGLAFFYLILQIAFCASKVLNTTSNSRLSCQFDNAKFKQTDVKLSARTLKAATHNFRICNCTNVKSKLLQGTLQLFSNFTPIRIDNINNNNWNISIQTQPSQVKIIIAISTIQYEYQKQKMVIVIAYQFQQQPVPWRQQFIANQLISTGNKTVLCNNNFWENQQCKIQAYYLMETKTEMNDKSEGNCLSNTNKFSLDLKNISDTLVESNLIRNSSYIVNISHKILFKNQEIALNITKLFPKVTNFLGYRTQQFNGFILSNEPSIHRRDDEYLNYSNLTKNSKDNFTSSFYYKTNDQIPLSFHHSMNQHVTVGYYDGNWTSKFSLILRKSIYYENVKANFSFNEQKDETGSLWAACFGLRFKDEFLNDSNTIFSTQIIVCPNSKYNFLPSGIYYKEVQIGRIKYKLYINRSNFNWTVFTFASNQNITNFTNFQLVKFIQETSNIYPEIDNYTLTTLQAGWKFVYGKSQFNLQKVEWYLKQKPILQCLISTYDIKQGKCISNKNINRAVQSMVNVPNIGLFIKVSPLLSLIDEFSYFVYHSTPYDKGFTFIINLSWNWTNSKFVPPQFIADALHLSTESTPTEKWINAAPNSTPTRFRHYNEDIYFLNNCKGFIIFTLPLSSIIFIILWKIYHKITQTKLAPLLKSFSSWTYLIVSVGADNSQYLSFRCFEQLTLIAFRNKIELLSIIVSLIILYSVILIAISLYLFAWRLSSQSFKPQNLIRHTTTYIVFSIWVSNKVIIGFIHAWITHPIVRMALILFFQVVFMVTVFYGGYFSRYKTPYVAFVVYQLFRTVLYFLILFQTIFPQDMIVVSDDNVSISNVTFSLVAVIFVMNGIFVILNMAIGLFIEDRETVLPINLKSREINEQFQLSPLMTNFQYERAKTMTQSDKFKTEDPTRKLPRIVQSSKKQELQELYYPPYFPQSPKMSPSFRTSPSSSSRNFGGIKSQLPKSQWNKLKKSNKPIRRIKMTRDIVRSKTGLKKTESIQSRRPWR